MQEEKKEPSNFSYLEMIDESILDNIFKQEDENIIAQGLLGLKQFIKDNKPSLDIFLGLLTEYFELDKGTQHIQQQLLDKLPKLIPIFGQTSTNSIVYKCCMTLLNQYKTKLDTFEKIRLQIADKEIWKLYNLDALPNFIHTFQLQKLIKFEHIDMYLDTLIEGEKWNDAVLIITAFDKDKTLATKLIHAMTRNKTASKAADYLKKFDLDAKDFPELQVRLNKNSIRFFIKDKQWYQIEDTFANKPEFLGYAVEDYFFKGMKNEAYSIMKRHQLLEKGYIQKVDILAALEGEIELGNLEEIPNPLIQNDSFQPTEEFIGMQEKGTFLNLSDFNIEEQDIIFIDSIENNENFDFFEKNILKEQDIGLDTEFSACYSKLEEQQNNTLSLIQLADSKHIYIIDLYSMQEAKLDLSRLKNVISQLLEGPQNKIGVGVSPDCGKLCSSYNLNIQKRTHNILELQKLFLKEFKGHKQSNLSYISKVILGKPISKEETMSDWLRRPLRKAQIHYAAMDAIISVKITEKIREKMNDKTIEKYVSDKLKPQKKMNNKEEDEDDDDFFF